VVHLPVQVEALGELPVSPAGKERVVATSGRGRTVLVVDDNADSADSLALLFRCWGHEVRVAYNGPEAIADAAVHRPDVVVLDIGMPGMTGYQVARRLREQPVSRQAFLVAVTGFGQDDDRRRAREAGFDCHLTKPVDPETLRELVANPAAFGEPVSTELG
jgi:CheY-like chemotaxis protein